MNHKFLLSLAVACMATAAHAQVTGTSFFNTFPNSQLGTVTNNLTLTDTATGFVVSGQVIVTVPSTSTAITGILASWVVDRPLTFPYGPNNVFTTTVLDGFSAPPPGTVGNSSGVVESIYTDYLGTTTSLSMVPMTLVAGVDSPAWVNLSNNSAVFSHTATGGQFLRQIFTLYGDYQSGPGGNWTIDVPVTTEVHVVPEPSTWALLAMAATALAGFGLRKRRA